MELPIELLYVFNVFAEFAPQCSVKMATALVVTSNWPLFVLWAEWINIFMYLFISVFICCHVTTRPARKCGVSHRWFSADLFLLKGESKQQLVSHIEHQWGGKKWKEKKNQKPLAARDWRRPRSFSTNVHATAAPISPYCPDSVWIDSRRHTPLTHTHTLLRPRGGVRPWLIIQTGQ